MLSFEEFIMACENLDPKNKEERLDRIAELNDEYDDLWDKKKSLVDEVRKYTHTPDGEIKWEQTEEEKQKAKEIEGKIRHVQRDIDNIETEINRLQELSLPDAPPQEHNDLKTREDIEARIEALQKKRDQYTEKKSGGLLYFKSNLTYKQRREAEKIHAQIERLAEKLSHLNVQKDKKVEEKISGFKKMGKWMKEHPYKTGGGALGATAAVGGLGYAGYKLLHRKKDSSNEGMLSFENWVVALENEDEYKEKPNYLKWGLGATAAVGAAGLLALAGSSKAKSVEKAFSSAKKDSKFKDSFRKRESEFTHHTPDKKEENVKKTASASTPSEKIEHKGHKTIVMYRVSRRWWSEHHPDLNKLANKIHHGSSEDTSQGAILPTIARMTEKKPDSNEWRPWKEISLDEVKKWNDPDTTFWVRYDYDDPDKKILKELDEHKAMSNAEHDHLRQVLYEYAHGERGKPVSVKYYRVLKGKDK